MALLFKAMRLATDRLSRTSLRVFAAVLLGHGALSGWCQTTESSIARDSPRPNEPAAAQVPVVGRLEIFQDGARVEIGFLSKVPSAGFVVAPHGTDRGIWLAANSDGSLRWSLQPGEYDLVAVRLQGSKGNSYSIIPVDGRLTVAAGGGTVDLGTLRAETGQYGARLRQVEPPATAASAAGDGAQALELRRRILGTFSRVVDVCASRWAVPCSKSLSGVTALDPPVVTDVLAMGAPSAGRVNSLRPNFSWKGPVGASYDFAVWRAVEYQAGTFAKPERTPGPLVHYAQALDRAEFADIPPLQPRSRYYWSVRLREGETVSTWSTTGHFTFLIVAMSSSSGKLFEFETP